MKARNFKQLLEGRQLLGAFFCIDLHGKKRELETTDSIVASNLETVVRTKSFAYAYKLDVTSFNKYDIEGLRAAYLSIKDIGMVAPTIPVILEGCNSPETAELLGADAVILNPYPGIEAYSHFLHLEDKGTFFNCDKWEDRGTFFNCHEFVGEMPDKEILLSEQDQMLFFGRVGKGDNDEQNGWTNRLSLFEYIAHKVRSLKSMAICGLVVDADPAKLATVRKIVGDKTPIIVKHIDNNFDRCRQIILAGQNKDHGGLILEQPPPTNKDGIPDYNEIKTLHDLMGQLVSN